MCAKCLPFPLVLNMLIDFVKEKNRNSGKLITIGGLSFRRKSHMMRWMSDYKNLFCCLLWQTPTWDFPHLHETPRGIQGPWITPYIYIYIQCLVKWPVIHVYFTVCLMPNRLDTSNTLRLRYSSLDSVIAGPNTCGLIIVAVMQHKTLGSHEHVKWIALNVYIYI